MCLEENIYQIVGLFLAAFIAILSMIEITHDDMCRVYPLGAPEWAYPVFQYKDMCSKCPICNYEDILPTHPYYRYPEISRDTWVFQRLVLDWQVKHEIFEHPICWC